jgi:penicillin-binding protein 1A
MEWKPDNVTREYTGINMTLRHAMAAVRELRYGPAHREVGWDNVAKYAHKVGITSPLLPVPSIGLGSAGDVSVYEMVNAYSTFMNTGFALNPASSRASKTATATSSSNSTPCRSAPSRPKPLGS